MSLKLPAYDKPLKKDEFEKLLSNLFVGRNSEHKIQYEEIGEDEDGTLSVKYMIYTEKTQYILIARWRDDRPEESYLGGSLMSRMARPGETWARGCDLSDGKANMQTLIKIAFDIIASEAQQLAKLTPHHEIHPLPHLEADL